MTPESLLKTPAGLLSVTVDFTAALLNANTSLASYSLDMDPALTVVDSSNTSTRVTLEIKGGTLGSVYTVRVLGVANKPGLQVNESFTVRVVSSLGEETLAPTPPSEPRNVRVTVSGTTVTMAFDPPESLGFPLAVNYTAHLGAGIQDRVVANSPAVFSGVPYGTYTAPTLRAANNSGIGPSAVISPITVGDVAPTFASDPFITGSAEPGQQLTGHPGTFTDGVQGQTVWLLETGEATNVYAQLQTTMVVDVLESYRGRNLRLVTIRTYNAGSQQVSRLASVTVPKVTFVAMSKPSASMSLNAPLTVVAGTYNVAPDSMSTKVFRAKGSVTFSEIALPYTLTAADIDAVFRVIEYPVKAGLTIDPNQGDVQTFTVQQTQPPSSVSISIDQQGGTVTVTMIPAPGQTTTENLIGVVGGQLLSVPGLSRTISVPANATYQPVAQAGINGVYSTQVTGAPAFLPVPMAVTGLPVISGTPNVGNDLAVTAAPVVGGAVSAIQWRRNGAPIAGAITAIYRLVAGDANAQISADVTYTNTSGQFTEVKQASPVGPVFDPTPVPEPTWTTMPQAAAAMGYGINATGLEFIPAWTNGAAKLTNQVIGLYKSSGLGHIRLPVRSEMYAANTTASTISQALWDEIDPIVDECIRIGMYLVIGYDHHNRNMMGDALSGATAVPDAEIETRAANRAAQFATRYGNRSKWIHLSPSNEPHGRMAGARWNKAYRQQLAAIRAIDADIPVWVNPVAFGNAWALGELDLASDAWLGIDTHVYLDIDYTHQGGFGYEASAGLVPFRASYMAQVLTAAKVMQRYSAAHAAVPMWAGEYGTTAYAPKREVNIRGTRQILDAAGFKSAIWSSTPPDFGVARLTGGQTTVTQSECICVVEYIGPVGGFVTVSSTGGDYNIGPETLTSSNAFTELLWRSAGKPDAVFTVSGLSGSNVQAKVHVLPFASANWSVTQTAEVVKADAPTHIDLVLPTFSFLPEMREAMLGLPAGAGVEAVPSTPASIINIGASPTRLSFSSNVGTWNAATQMMEFTAGGPTALEYIVVAPSTPLVAGEDYQVSFINEGTGCASVAICDTQSATPYSTVPSGADTGLAPWDATTPVKTLTAASLPPNAGFVIAFQQRRKYTPASYETEVSVAVKPSIGYTLKIESCGAGFTGAAKIRGGSTLATWGVADVGTTKTVTIPSGEYELVLERTSTNANEESRVDVYPTSGTETTAIGVHICTVEDSGGSQVVAPGAISNLRFGTTSLDGVPIAWDAAPGATSYDVRYVSASGTVTVNTTSSNILLTDIGGVTSFGVEVTPKNTVAGPSSSMPFYYYTALTWAVGYTGGTTVIALEPIVRTRGGVEFTANPGAGTITVKDNAGATFSTRGPGSATSSVAVTTQRLLILSSAGGSCSTQVNAFWASKLTAGSAAGSMVSGANVTITPPTFSNLTEFSLRYGLNYYDAATGTHDDALPTDAVSSTVIAIPASKVGKYIKSAEYFIFGSDYPNFAVQAGRISLNGISVDALPGAGPVAAPATQASLTNSTAATGVPVALASVSGAVLVNGLSITVAAGSDSGTGMVAVFARTSGGAEVYLTSFGAASAGDVFQTGPLPDDTASVIFKPAGATGSTYSYTLTVTAA